MGHGAMLGKNKNIIQIISCLTALNCNVLVSFANLQSASLFVRSLPHLVRRRLGATISLPTFGNTIFTNILFLTIWK